MTPNRWALEPFPVRWRAFLHATSRNLLEVQLAYQVSEKTARKWWDGIGGCNGDKVARAVRLHPEEADHYVFGNTYAIAAE